MLYQFRWTCVKSASLIVTCVTLVSPFPRGTGCQVWKHTTANWLKGIWDKHQAPQPGIWSVWIHCRLMINSTAANSRSCIRTTRSYPSHGAQSFATHIIINKVSITLPTQPNHDKTPPTATRRHAPPRRRGQNRHNPPAPPAPSHR